KSCRVRPLRFSRRGTATVGAISRPSPCTKSTAATSASRNQACTLSPRGPAFAGQQYGSRTIGKSGGIARGERAVARRLVERGFQRGEFLQRGVGAQEAVALDAAERHDQVLEEAGVVGGGELAVAGQR